MHCDISGNSSKSFVCNLSGEVSKALELVLNILRISSWELHFFQIYQLFFPNLEFFQNASRYFFWIYHLFFSNLEFFPNALCSIFPDYLLTFPKLQFFPKMRLFVFQINFFFFPKCILPEFMGKSNNHFFMSIYIYFAFTVMSHRYLYDHSSFTGFLIKNIEHKLQQY